MSILLFVRFVFGMQSVRICDYEDVYCHYVIGMVDTMVHIWFSKFYRDFPQT